MINKKYSLPKYRRRDRVSLPDKSTGFIMQIRYEGGENWYEVNNSYYAEREITKINY
jgi:hypothetical protein